MSLDEVITTLAATYLKPAHPIYRIKLVRTDIDFTDDDINLNYHETNVIIEIIEDCEEYRYKTRDYTTYPYGPDRGPEPTLEKFCFKDGYANQAFIDSNKIGFKTDNTTVYAIVSKTRLA